MSTRTVLDLAARLEALAGFVDENLAKGVPAKYLARTCAETIREVAATARAEVLLECFPADVTRPDIGADPRRGDGWAGRWLQ